MMTYTTNTVRGKYNIWKLAEDEGISIKEIMSLLGCYPNKLRNYRITKVEKSFADKVEELVLSTTDYPEKYEFKNCPYIGSGKGRRLGIKNKNSSVKYITPIKTSFSSLKKIVNSNNIEEDTIVNTIKEVPYKELKVKKIDLQDYMDILDALDNGNTVYQKDSNYSFIKYNGIIIRLNNDNPVFISPSIDLSQSYYTYKKEKIKLEIGKTYITEGNEKVVITGIADNFKAIVLNSTRYIDYTEEGEAIGCKDLNSCQEILDDLKSYNILGEAI